MKRFLHLIMIVVILQACNVVRPDLKLSGSVDMSNQHEGGASALVDGEDLGWNVAGGIWSSMPQNLDFHGDYVGDAKPDPTAGFAIYTQLEFIRKGSKFQDTHTHLNYLDLSGNFVYYKKMADHSMIFGGLGPYIGYGLGGKVSGGGFSENAFGGQDGYKRFDAGLSVIGQYELPSSLFFGLGYEFGLANKSPAPDYTSRNRTFYFSAGYSLTKLLKGGKK
jgi:hypothetical protein